MFLWGFFICELRVASYELLLKPRVTSYFFTSYELHFMKIKSRVTSWKLKVRVETKKKILTHSFFTYIFEGHQHSLQFIRTFLKKFRTRQGKTTSADLEVQLVQLNHCSGAYSNYWNTLLRNLKLSPYINFYV